MKTQILKYLSNREYTKIIPTFLLGTILAIMIYSTYSILKVQLYLREPISNTFVSELIVPDFIEGSVPNVQYYRTIKQTFVGDFRVEIKDIKSNIALCSGNDKSIAYDVGEEHEEPIDLDWYTNNDCTKLLVPGQYFVETLYTIHKEGLPDRYVKTISNTFTVFPKDLPVQILPE